MSVGEYWVVDVNRSEIIAFTIFDGGSKPIQTSQVLPGLTMAFIQETLKRSLTQEHGAVTRWIINQFS
jgi:hypothetical protein